MPENPLVRLNALGQSVWYDYIRRDLFTTGQLDRMIREDRLCGMTSNPTIFAQAIAKSDLYDAEIRGADPAADPAKVFEALAVAEIRRAADAFRPVFDRAKSADGHVSIEVSPTLAHQTKATIEEARRLWKACDRQNVMIKIPGTKAGLPAIETCLAEGINVNVTLLFSVERYREVMEAWFRALEARAGNGQPIDQIASVASFFVSRVDGAVDKALDQKAAAAPADQARLLGLKSKLAIHNARLAYAAWQEVIGNSPRFAKLKAKGAQAQRPLFASTSTKDPALPDVYYMEALVAPHTVNTVPPQTYDAYRDHGQPAVRIGEDLAGARAALAALAAAGIDFAALMQALEDDGVKKFQDSFTELLQSIRDKRAKIQAR